MYVTILVQVKTKTVETQTRDYHRYQSENVLAKTRFESLPVRKGTASTLHIEQGQIFLRRWMNEVHRPLNFVEDLVS